MCEAVFIHRLRDVVDRHADRSAVFVDGRVTLTYRQLWQAATHVASRLQEHGVGRESVVGLHLPRSADFIVAMIGVWRAGAAYVPLAPSLPPSRLEFMARDAGVRVLITDSSCAPTWSPDLPLLAIDRDARDAGSRFEPLTPDLADLAYVIYTSGTTGHPKGVAVEQRGLVGLLDAQLAAFDIQPDSRALFLLSPSFDASISDIGTTLLSGATLCIESQHAVDDGIGVTRHDLFETLRNRRITHVDLPPSLLAMLNPSEPIPTLRTIVIGGEPCRPDVVRMWARRCRVVNVYGPTEATVCTSLCVCDPDGWHRPLLGHPIGGVTYRIRTEGGTRDDPNTGELMIAGPCLARGYVNRPELTAARFVTNGGRRWYRTGDLVRRDSDGAYVFLGRCDRQLKLNGRRIEPAEIEAVVASAEGVGRCAVVPRQVSPGNARQTLVAFVAPSDPSAGTLIREECLQKYAAGSLPQWMVPRRFEFVAQLPLTLSGKIDRAKLATLPLASKPATESELSALERELLTIWSRVLDVACGPQDDFFELGGDSLAVLEVATLAASRGIEISPALVAAHPTVRAISAQLTSSRLPDDLLVRSADELRHDVSSLAAELRETIAAQSVGSRTTANARKQLLLTGATGFLGCRVLEQVLRQTDLPVVCLVRARNATAARQRLQEALRRQQIEVSTVDLARVSTVAGDISRPNCDLDSQTWTRLAETASGILHCAARVHVLDSYEELRATNVQGLFEVLRLCGHGAPKQFHYASTLSVFVGADRRHGRMLESDDLSRTEWVFGGYAQSKWASEVLLREVQAPPGCGSVFRFGLLAVDSRTGIAPQRDLLTLAVRGLVQVDCVPDKVPDVSLDVTPVDFAAAAMVRLATSISPNSMCRTFHVANPPAVSLRRLIHCLRTLRPGLKQVSAAQFLKQVERNHKSRQAAACLGMSRWLTPDQWTRHRSLDLFQATGAEFDMTNTAQGLSGTGIDCPPADDQLVTGLLRGILDR